MSIEQAAAAFDADMNGGKAPAARGGEPSAEPLFTNLGNLEVDDDSPSMGGGDDEVQEPRAQKKARKQDDELVGFDEEEEDGRRRNEDGDEDVDEDEIDDNDEDPDADEDDEDPLLSKEFEVMVDGEEVKVSVKDALKNFSHREAVDRRMNFVDQARQAVVAEGQNVIALRQQVDAQLAEAEEILKALIPAEPNWDELFAKDPGQARALQKQYEGFKAKIDEIRGKREENARKAQENDTADIVRYRNAEAKKFAGFAKWDSAKSRDKDMASMRRTALSLGFSEQEVGQVMDSRMLAVLLKASKYDRMMANKPKPAQVRQQQKPGNPGAGRTRTAPKGNDRAMKNLQRTGSVEAAANVFAGILKRS